jgi:CheY-like chemotaxis protein
VALRLVVIDDNRAFLRAATRLLEGEGQTVLGVASTGEDGVALVAAARPELVLLDVELGEDDGFDVARRIAALADGPPVLLISSRSETDLRELVSHSPAIGFLTKSQLSAAALGEYYRRSR